MILRAEFPRTKYLTAGRVYAVLSTSINAHTVVCNDGRPRSLHWSNFEGSRAEQAAALASAPVEPPRPPTDAEALRERAANLVKAHVRGQADEALAALGMVHHVTGSHWASTWSSLSLLRKTLEAGGTLVIPSLGPDHPGKTLTTEGLLESLSATLAEIPQLTEALSTALKDQPNPDHGKDQAE